MGEKKIVFLVKLERFAPLVDATSRLARIAKRADVLFTPSPSLWLATTHTSPRFTAMLQMSPSCFVPYFVKDGHCSSVSLEPFHDAMMDSMYAASMTIHLSAPNQMILRFDGPEHVQEFQHILPLSPLQDWDLEKIDSKKCFFVRSQDLRRVIKELPLFQDDPIYVTTTPSRVKFSVRSREIILTKKDGECGTDGFEGKDEIRMKIILNPMLFFLDLTYDVERVWFYKTRINSHCVMLFPVFGIHAQYLLYFPQI